MNLEDRLQRQIVQADSILYQAVLTFIEQDIASYVKGGWLLRRAWKIYEKTHREIKGMYDALKVSTNGDTANVGVGVGVAMEGSDRIDTNDNEIPDEVVERLFGSVNFGYGTFQLCISMIPPKLLKLIEFLGFEGDQSVGLNSLEFSSNSRDMKAPLAT